MASGNAEVAAAEAKVEAAKQEVAAAEAKVAAAEAKVAAAEAKVAAAEEKLEAIEDQLCEGGLSEEKRKVLEDRKIRAQRGLDGAQRSLDGAEDGLKIARKGLDGAQDVYLRLQRATDAGTRATDCSVPVPRPGSHFSILDVVFRLCFHASYGSVDSVLALMWLLALGVAPWHPLSTYAVPFLAAAPHAWRCVLSVKPHVPATRPRWTVLVLSWCRGVVCAGPSWWRLGSLLRTSAFPGAAGS